MVLKVHIDPSGFVMAESNEMVFRTWCTDIGEARNWPSDHLTCNIELGVKNGNFTLIPSAEFFKVNLMRFC